MNEKIPRLLIAVASLSGAARTQGFDWSSRFGSTTPDAAVSAIGVFDDPSGSGQVAYIGGQFTSVGGCRARGVARWDGVAWSALGEGLSGLSSSPIAIARAFAMFDSGAGGELVAAGSFSIAGTQPASSIARWNGTSWSALQGPLGQGLFLNGFVTPGTAHDLAVFDDGSGACLWVSGYFDGAGGVGSPGVARWNGTQWLPAFSGLIKPCGSLAVFDDGSGAHLYVAGTFGGPVAPTFPGVARWNGVSWDLVGTSFAGIQSLAVFDDGNGPRLYAAGSFAGRIVQWDGATWNVVGGGAPSGIVNELAIYDDGSGPALLAGGSFSAIGGVSAPRLAKWNGAAWSTFGGVASSVQAIGGGDFGSHGGRRLLVGSASSSCGPVTGAEIPAPNLALWDGAQWSGIFSDGVGTSGPVTSLGVYDDGRGDALYAGGTFASAGALTANNIARWDGEAWEPLGSGTNSEVRALMSYDGGGVNALYAGGTFSTAGGVASKAFARWGGTSWSTVVAGSQVNAAVNALIVFDDGAGAALFVGGDFDSIGGISATNVAKWDGYAWSAIGAGLSSDVRAFGIFDSGSGPELYAGGGSLHGYLARLTGTSWTMVPGSIDEPVHALQGFDAGTGPALYVGGELLFAGGVAVDHLGRWDGSSWSSVLAIPLERRVRALAVFDEGQGARLYAGGQDAPYGGFLGRVESNALIPLGLSPTGGQLAVLAQFADGKSARPALYAGGGFDEIGGLSSNHFARWAEGHVAPATSYCTAGTTANGCTATISASGEACRCLVSGFDVNVTGIEGQKLGILFFGNAATATHWGAGTSYVCVAPPTTRASTQLSGGTSGACDGAFTLDFNAWMYANPFKAPAPGANVFMQAWFRDPPSPKGTSLSDSLTFEVAP